MEKYYHLSLFFIVLSHPFLMYLQSLSISNLLSFAESDHSDAHHTIVWSGDEDNRVNIMIGPNGSGKSNTLEILNQTIKA
ncbi:MAG: hypothetical protein H6766_02450 [Candidatus Peribacteria bacterium]|nr:MAG: hypothetical protein H6766_02450 [Candidatus Peribacteria bacterium]